MYVGRIMHTDLITVTPDTSIVKARDIITEKKIAHLLVVDKKNNLLGIVSDRDLKQSWASPATTLSTHELNYLLTQLTVDMIMVRKTINISPETTVERAAHLMQQNRISALPVIENEKLVGIITTTDVLGVLLEAIGMDQDSTRFTVLVIDRIGCIADVARLLKDNDVNIRSLFTWPEKKHPGVYQLVLRVGREDLDKAVEILTQGGYKVLTQYVKDLSPYLPEG